MTRAKLYRRWSSGRLASELARSLRRASELADELHRREQEAVRADRKMMAFHEAEAKRPDPETEYLLAHLSGEEP